jgi:hypothetical protein
VETYEEWRLIFEVGKRDARGVIDEAIAETPDDVDIHRRGDQILAYAHSEEAIQKAENVVSRLLELRGLTTASDPDALESGRRALARPPSPDRTCTARHRPGMGGARRARLGSSAQDGGEARRLTQELSEAGHPTITGLGNRITVGVADQLESSSLADDLRLRAPTARIQTRPLSRWRRWLIRQRLLGNYAGSGGDFGGAGGRNGGGG